MDPWVGTTPLEEEIATRSNILAGKFHGQRSLVGYNPRGHKQLDTTEQLNVYFVSGFFWASVSFKPLWIVLMKSKRL